MAAEEIVRFKDFSTSPEPVTFRIDPDLFVCWPEIPLDSLVELATLNTGGDDRKAQFDRIKDFLDGIMEPESGAQFRARCKPSTKEEPNPRPIGMKTISQLIPWLTEVYGLRPTQESNESDGGSQETDTTSTDSSSAEA
jgi:hypothetical protein